MSNCGKFVQAKSNSALCKTSGGYCGAQWQEYCQVSGGYRPYPIWEAPRLRLPSLLRSAFPDSSSVWQSTAALQFLCFMVYSSSQSQTSVVFFSSNSNFQERESHPLSLGQESSYGLVQQLLLVDDTELVKYPQSVCLNKCFAIQGISYDSEDLRT